MASFDFLIKSDRAIQNGVINAGGGAGFIQILGFVVHSLGMGPIQLHLAGVVAYALALLLLIHTIHQLGLPVLCAWLLIFWSTTYSVLGCIAACLPETFLLLAIVINFYWLALNKGRGPALVSGFLAVAMMAFHSSIIFYLFPFPFIWLSLKITKRIQTFTLFYWVIGALAGCLYVLRTIDFDRFIQYLLLVRGTAFIQSPNIFLAKGSPWDMLNLGLTTILTKPPFPLPGLYALYMGILLAASIWSLSRFQKLSGAERIVLLFAIPMFTVYCVCNSSPTPKYWLYIFPWLLINFGVVVTNLFKNKFIPTAQSYFWLGLLTFICVQVLYNFNMPSLSRLWIILILLNISFAVSFSAAVQLGWRWLLGLLVVAGLTFLDNKYIIAQYKMWLWFLNRSHPLMLAWIALALALPWLAYAFSRGKYSPKVSSKSLAVFLLAMTGAYWAHTTYLGAADGVKSFKNREWMHRVPDLRNEKVIIGPLALKIYDVSLPLHSHEALYHGAGFHRPINPVPSILALNPTLILWPVIGVPTLQKQFKRETHGKVGLEAGPVWETPYGDYREIRLYFHQSLAI